MRVDNLPQHVAFILDGNRRWARERKLPTFNGHKKGYEVIESIVDHAMFLGIPYLTFWAFSTENWHRDKKEVSSFLNLFRVLLKKGVNRLREKGVKLGIIGELERFPPDIVKQTEALINETKNNTAVTVNFGVSYGGRAEIIRAVNSILQDGLKQVDDQIFSSYLYTSDIPDPDLIIRTGGELRLSGFLPWQSVYSELYFTKMYWPEFDKKAFDKAIREYNKRQRRFGK